MEVSMSSGLFSSAAIFCVLNLVIGTIIITSRLKLQNRGGQLSGQDLVNSPPPSQLVRTTSLLDRVKSFNFSSYYRSDEPGPLHSDGPREQAEEMTADVHDDDDEDPALFIPTARVNRLRRSKSETSTYTKAPTVAVEEEVADNGESTVQCSEDEAVDEKADDFINRFRQQLKLQRMDSLLRCREMLRRGLGGG